MREALAELGADLTKLYRPSDRTCKVICLFRGDYLVAESSAPPSSAWTPWALEDWLYGDLVDREIPRLLARASSGTAEPPESSDPQDRIPADPGRGVATPAPPVEAGAPACDRSVDLPGRLVLGVRPIEVRGGAEISAVELSEEARRGLCVGVVDAGVDAHASSLAAGSVVERRVESSRVGRLRQIWRVGAAWFARVRVVARCAIGRMRRAGRRRSAG